MWYREIRGHEHRVGTYVRSVLPGLVGVVLVLLCTGRYGVGLSPDTASYFSAARSLLSGDGYRYFDGGIYTHWPPLFPTLLAIPGLVGIDAPVAARWINAFAFGGIVFFAARLLGRCVTSTGVATLGMLSILLSTPLLAVSCMAWSEPVFILLAVLFMLYVPRFMQTKRRSALLMLSALAGLACLERYAGVTLIVTGGIVIALGTPKASILERLKYSAGFCLFSSIPLALWLFRNHALTGQTVGAHHFSWARIGEMGRPLVAAGDVVATWFSSRTFPGISNTALVGLILLLAAVLVTVSHWKPGQPGDRKSIVVWSAGLFVLVYTGFIAFSGAGLAWNPEQRHMAPAYVFAMVLVFAGVDHVPRLLGKYLENKALVHWTGLALMALWLLYPLGRAYRTIKLCEEEGAGEYTIRTWKESALIRWLCENRLEGAICSNLPDALYLLAGVSAKETPHHGQDAAECAAGMHSSRANYVVWSHWFCRSSLYDLRELSSRWRLETVAELSDGAVYRFLGAGDFELLSVHRFWSSRRNQHLYTLDARERDGLITHQSRQWTNEGSAFYVFAESSHPAGALPVYRLWSPAVQTCLYTIDQEEKDAALACTPRGWENQGVAWYAFGEKERPSDARPVHRFRSEVSQDYFYTIDEAEKDKLIANFPHVWTYEGIAWYAYGK